MARLAVGVLMILILACACGSSRDNSTKTSGTAGRVPEPEAERPARGQKDVSQERELADVPVEISEPDYIEMPRPGVISRYDKTVRKYARRYLFDWRLISAQIYTESRFRHQARSYRGALGLMQIMPGTAQWLEGKAEKEAPELKSASQMLVKPEVNIHFGCYYDAMLLSRIKDARSGDDRSRMMFAAYNAGPGNLSRARRESDAPNTWEGIRSHLPAETRKYIPTIYGKYEIYKQWAVLKPY